MGSTWVNILQRCSLWTVGAKADPCSPWPVGEKADSCSPRPGGGSSSPGSVPTGPSSWARSPRAPSSGPVLMQGRWSSLGRMEPRPKSGGGGGVAPVEVCGGCLIRFACTCPYQGSVGTGEGRCVWAEQRRSLHPEALKRNKGVAFISLVWLILGALGGNPQVTTSNPLQWHYQNDWVHV